MPAEHVHYIFADSNISKSTPYRDALLLGSQGSDPFFYYGYSFNKKRPDKKKVQEFGSFIHSADLVPLIRYVRDYILSKTGEEKGVLAAYFKGFLMHYCVDRNCHPYIWYRSGHADSEKDKAKYLWLHMYFESNLDAAYKKASGYEKFKIYKATKIDKTKLLYISRLYYYLAKDLYEIDYVLEDSFFKAVKDMTFVSKILYSKSGWKKAIVEQRMKYTIVNAIITPKKIYDEFEVDYLNKHHREWRHPVTGKIYTYSFSNLLKKAEEEYKKVWSLLNVNDPKIFLYELRNFVNELNHDGCKINTQMRYQDVFYHDPHLEEHFK